MTENDEPYKPKYKGFDEETTKRAHATNDRSQEVQAGKGEDSNSTYMDEGRAEYRRRTGNAPPGEEAD